MYASIQCRLDWVITICVLFYFPDVGYKLRSKIIRAPTFKFSLDRGNLEDVWDCKNS